jgi:hypothetical protein
MTMRDEGSIAFTLRHADAGWDANDRGYDFGPIQQGDVSVSASKRPDRTLEVTASGPFGQTVAFHGPMPYARDDGGIKVTITWKDRQVHLYLNGLHAQTAPVPRTDDA